MNSWRRRNDLSGWGDIQIRNLEERLERAHNLLREAYDVLLANDVKVAIMEELCPPGKVTNFDIDWAKTILSTNMAYICPKCGCPGVPSAKADNKCTKCANNDI